METTDKAITNFTHLLWALNDFSKQHPILNNFYSIHMHCDNIITMQGNFTDKLYDYLLANNFSFIIQNLISDDKLSIELHQPFYSIYGKYDVVIKLIDKKSK